MKTVLQAMFCSVSQRILARCNALLILLFSFILLLISPTSSALDDHAADSQSQAEVPKVQQVLKHLYCGGEPSTEDAFRALSEFGIKTLVSVDGIRPRLAMAKKFRMSYVHIPLGYHGVSREQQLSLARALRDCEKPIYVHCHHGRHRAPTAAAVMCVTSGAMSANQALQILRTGGTSQQYVGLWNAVKNSEPLAENEVDFPELTAHASVTNTVGAMARIERHLQKIDGLLNDKTDRILDEAWRHSEVSALNLYEELRELERTSPTTEAEFKHGLRQAEAIAKQLLQAVRLNEKSSAAKEFRRLSASCTACHEQLRD